METINIIIGVAGLIIAIGLGLIPYFRKVYFVGPELTIELFPDGGYNIDKGQSGKNDRSKGYIDEEHEIHVFEITWLINLKITNNSNITAYYPEIKFHSQQLSFSHLDKLDKNKPIKGDEQIILKGKYSMFEECESKNRTQATRLPENLKDLKILLEYKNPNKKKFYTIFTNSGLKGNNKYTRRPKELKDYKLLFFHQ